MKTKEQQIAEQMTMIHKSLQRTMQHLQHQYLHHAMRDIQNARESLQSIQKLLHK